MTAINAVHVSDEDSCVTVTAEIKKGQTVAYQASDASMHTIVANDDVPIYHKIAVAPISKDDYAIKYGEKIGQALEDIKPGDYVHIHNLKKVGFIEEA